MATTLGLDIGSSSVIAGILRGTKVLAEAPRAIFHFRHSGPNVGLIRASAERLLLLAATGTRMKQTIAASGGLDQLDRVMHRDWPGRWKCRAVTDATMRGRDMLMPRAM